MPSGVVIARSLIPDVTSVNHGRFDVHVLRDELVEDQIGLADVRYDVSDDRVDQVGVAGDDLRRPSVLVPRPGCGGGDELTQSSFSNQCSA